MNDTRIEYLKVVDDRSIVPFCFLAVQYRSEDRATHNAMRAAYALFDTPMAQMSDTMHAYVGRLGWTTAVVQLADAS